MGTLESEYHAWRQTPQSEMVMDIYRRLAKEAAGHASVFDIRRLALGGVQFELWKDRDPELGAPKYKVYDLFLEYIWQDLISEIPELEPFMKPPARRPGGRNAWHSGAIR